MSRIAAPLIVAALCLGRPSGALATPRPSPAARKAPAKPAVAPKPVAEAPAAPPAAPAAAQPKKAEAAAGGPDVVKTEETKTGVKTYEFGATEVEGRLRSPQIIYFLRRVRAEFEAGDLGHRSFMRELAETQRSPSLR